MEGCNLTMHEQCLYEYEADVGYEHAEDDEEHYCPKHHLCKEESSDDDEEEDDEGVGVSKAITPAIPSLPPLPDGTECDWHTSTTGCKLPTQPTMKCQHEGCIRQVHHLCSIEWEASVSIEESTISSYYCYHHPIYPTRNQLSTLPITVNNPP
jgi:hypothetical protein